MMLILAEILLITLGLVLFLIWFKYDFLPKTKKNAPLSAKLLKGGKLFLACFILVSLSTIFIQVEGDSQEQTFAAAQSGSLDQDDSTGKPSSPKPPSSSNSSLSVDYIQPGEIKTRFKDIAGYDEVKTEVKEVIDFFINPKKYKEMGAKVPKGILLYGPPGTGKTMMARAVAGEAGVAFLAVSGSAFEQEYIGVGAARVRALFEYARKVKPAIVFIDEIDSLLPNRQKGKDNLNQSQIQTVNQVLAELDNVNEDVNQGIMVIGATNNLYALDTAALRPGRFDRKILVRLPNKQERAAIVQNYLDKVKASKDINANSIAGTTPGFSGAELANLVNEAAILAVRNNHKVIEKSDIEQAKDKLTLGMENKSAQISEEDRRNTAYHEAGHAIVGLLAENFNLNLNKITVSMRDSTLGVTHFELPDDQTSYTRAHLEDVIAVKFGGRIAEEMVMGSANVTTGAQNDISTATDIAQKMVYAWSLSRFSEVVALSELEDYPKNMAYDNVEEILRRGYEKAKRILEDNEDKLHKLAKALLEKETLSRAEVFEVLGMKDKSKERN